MKKIISLLMATVLAMACFTGCSSIIPTEPTGSSIMGPKILPVGSSYEYAYKVDFKEDANQDGIQNFLSKLELVWLTSDEAVATVDENGVVTAHKTGEVTIQACDKEQKYCTTIGITVMPKYQVSERVYATVGKPVEFEITQVVPGGMGLLEFPYDNVTFEIPESDKLTVTEDKMLVAAKHGEVEVALVIEGERYPVIIQIEKLMSGLTLDADELPSDEEMDEAGDELAIEEPAEEVTDDEVVEDVTEEVVESPEAEAPENEETSESAAPEVKPGMNIIIVPTQPVAENAAIEEADNTEISEETPVEAPETPEAETPSETTSDENTTAESNETDSEAEQGQES